MGVVAGVACGILGLWMLRNAKRDVRAPADGAEASGAERAGLTAPTRMTVGITAILVGYHLVAWSVPRPMFGVPVDRWWIVACVAVLAVVGALVADRVERAKGI